MTPPTRTASIHSVTHQRMLNRDPAVTARFDSFFETATIDQIDTAAQSAIALRDRIKPGLCAQRGADL
ncbi:hypothetical protein [Acidiphilium acidophilum]|uniref:hypothetical protein n=1 Tax=Acidiphilium acidophilum TaxID=76588 RepID=UPI002E8E667D|nr:hypothetical protein [Acidiphilium acidophilum]